MRTTGRRWEFALVAATCGCALALALDALSPALGQSLNNSTGLRGSTALSTGRSTGPAPLGGDPSAGLTSPPPPPASYAAGSGDPPPGAAINYGKARKLQKKPLLNPPAKKAGRPLPQLEAYKTSYPNKQKARLRGGLPDDSGRQQPQPPVNYAVPPTIVARTPKPEEPKPFDPVGLKVGSLRLNPYLEALGGYDTNPYRQFSKVKSSPMLRGEIGTTMQSEWSKHGLVGEMRLGFSNFPRVKDANRPDGLGKVDGKIDVMRDTTLDYGGNFSITTLRPGSPEIQASTNGVASTNQPVTWSAGAYAGGTHTFNRLEVGMRGALERTQTGDATFSNGTTQQLSLNDYTTYAVKPRVAYEVTPGFKPFVEGSVDRRQYDHTYDVNGFMRSSYGYSVKGGASFEIIREVKGEISGGYVMRNYEDPRLPNLRGPLLDASIVWTASPLTTVTLRANTTASETTLANASGAMIRTVSAQVKHELLRNLTITGTAAYQVTSYQGNNLAAASQYTTVGINERLLTAGVKAEYAIMRGVYLKASYAYEYLKSTVPNSGYVANVFLLGVKLQR